MESKISKFKCDLCNKYFSQSSSRNRHIRESHLQPNIHRCEQCKSGFSKKYNLQVHIERVHSKNRKQMKYSPSNRSFAKSGGSLNYCTNSHPNFKSNSSLNNSFKHADETDAQNVAGTVLKELKQLQLDIQKSRTPMPKCFENVEERENIGKRTVKLVTVKDNLYPQGNFTLLKAKTITNANGLKYFICEFCSKEFRKTYNFLRHRRIHTKVRPFLCVLCKAAFPTTTQLKAHCSIHKLHDQLGVFHKLYKCPKCDEGFCAISQFDKHISSSDCKISFKCSKCLKFFRTLKTRLRHKHSENDSELEVLKALLPVPLNEELQLAQYNIRSFECSTCGMKVKEKTSFKHHVKRHENLFKYQCATCQKSFGTESMFKIHNKRHLGSKNVKCFYCSNCFTTSQSCRRHMETHIKRLLETGENKEDTVHCIPTFIENEKNKPAVKTVISIIRNEKAFKAKEEKVCTDENLKYKCLKCAKSFRYNSWLKKHFKYKHTNELPFKCSRCGKEFRTKQSLEFHLLVHSAKRLKLICQVCARQYSSSKSLKLHLRIHTQETPFRCEKCNKKFRTSGHLNQHCKSYHKKS